MELLSRDCGAAGFVPNPDEAALHAPAPDKLERSAA
jgi:hypothetical protein